MKYTTAGAFRTALQQRIPIEGEARGVSIARVRKEIVFERLLARLTVVAPGRWVLKGGLALDFRLGSIAQGRDDGAEVRIVVDFVASLSEAQALAMHHRLTGISLGSVLHAASP